jgi:hypothetical protein
MKQLKPCPFCGAKVKISKSPYSIGHPSTAPGGGFISYGTAYQYSILCETDDCFLKVCRMYKSEDKLIAEWNCRSSEKIEGSRGKN